MKNVVITGHTSGIGKAMYEYFISNNCKVTGFSKSNGYDIGDEISQQHIIDSLDTADIFVNNAYKNFTDDQLKLLIAATNVWKNKDKLIINISSRAAGAMHSEYAISKLKLDDFCQSNLFMKPNILNLKPGLTDTNRVRSISGNKMKVEEVIKVLNIILNLNVRIHNITFGA
jgi:NAD(P)-dependent dehydrogenase (short-subunit alcohol dehydrogenase family)